MLLAQVIPPVFSADPFAVSVPDPIPLCYILTSFVSYMGNLGGSSFVCSLLVPAPMSMVQGSGTTRVPSGRDSFAWISVLPPHLLCLVTLLGEFDVVLLVYDMSPVDIM